MMSAASGHSFKHAPTGRHWELQRSAKIRCMTPICSAAMPLLQLKRIDSIPVESIQDNLIVVEEMPGLCESWHGTRYVWLARNKKLEWPSMF
jgi:hypothetical protein